jgi:acetolactate synthase-1/2/3 large subunit
VTNAISVIASARANGSPLVVIGGRASVGTWGRGSLQELDHVAFVGPLAKHAATAVTPADVAPAVAEALRIAGSPHRGAAFVDIPMDTIFSPADLATMPVERGPERGTVDDDAVSNVAEVLGGASRPVVVAGTDVWMSGAETALVRLVETIEAPVVTNGMGRGCVPAGHGLAVSRARGAAFKGADLVLVIGTPLDFRLGFGQFGDAEVVHIADVPERVASHRQLAAGAAGDLPGTLDALAAAVGGPSGNQADERRLWAGELRDVERGQRAEEEPLLTSDAAPIHPARVHGELRRRLDPDAVTIGAGGDFVSFAGRYLDSHTPGCWLDPGPYGCLGTGMGYAAAARLAHPGRQVCVLLGDGAAGFSLMDVETLVRHDLPVVMVVGNNGIWALEKYPMQQVYDGWDAAADLRPGTRYEEIVRTLGGAGETVTEPAGIGPALDRAFASGVPYMVNVLTDPQIAYPRRAALM